MEILGGLNLHIGGDIGQGVVVAVAMVHPVAFRPSQRRRHAIVRQTKGSQRLVDQAM